MTDFGVAGVAGITVICYLVGLIAKSSRLPDEWIPCVVGAVGAALGLVGLFLTPGFPASEPIGALAVGIVSGLAATGAHQLKKQLEDAHGTD